MDRNSLTWNAALADPSAAAAKLRRLEEDAEAYIARSRTLRQWLENVPPLPTVPSGSGTRPDLPDEPSDDDEKSGAASPAGGQGPGTDGAPGASRSSAEGGEREAPVPGPAAGDERDGAGDIPPPRQAGGPEAGAEPSAGHEQAPEPADEEQPTLYERVEAVLAGFRPGAHLTTRGVALEIGHDNLRSLRPILDRMSRQGLLVKTELHPRAVVYHRPEPGRSPEEAPTS